jgi:NAD/NADP transhydrogenase beta subunit
MLTAYILLLVLLFTATPLAWAVAGGIVLVYLVWLRRMALPANAAGFVWARVRREPRLLVRLLAAATSLAVALVIGAAAARLDPGPGHFDPTPELLAIVATIVGSGAAVRIADQWSASRHARVPIAERPPPTAMDVPVAFDAAARRLAFLCFMVALMPAVVLFGPAIDPDPDRALRGFLGTALLAGTTLVTWWIIRRQRRLSAEVLAWWSRVPAVALPAFSIGWLVLVAFLIGAAYLPDGSPLLVDVLAVGAFVAVGAGLLLLVVVLIVLALRRLWRLLVNSGGAPPPPWE